MSITRRGLADEIDHFDEQIADLNTMKAAAFAAYRRQMEDAGSAKSVIKLEVEATKKAIRVRRALKDDPDAVAEKDALVDEIVAEISGTRVDIASTVRHARRAPRTRPDAPPHDPDTGEITEPEHKLTAREVTALCQAVIDSSEYVSDIEPEPDAGVALSSIAEPAPVVVAASGAGSHSIECEGIPDFLRRAPIMEPRS